MKSNRKFLSKGIFMFSVLSLFVIPVSTSAQDKVHKIDELMTIYHECGPTEVSGL